MLNFSHLIMKSVDMVSTLMDCIQSFKLKYKKVKYGVFRISLFYSNPNDRRKNKTI